MKNIITLLKFVTPILSAGLAMPLLHDPSIIQSFNILIRCVGICFVLYGAGASAPFVTAIADFFNLRKPKRKNLKSNKNKKNISIKRHK
jgi:hypothetical protein